MSTRAYFKIRIAPLILLLTFLYTGSGFCQEINLDKMKKLGDLVCYQSLKDPASWYYLPDQPRLAMKNGKPQFSFMKYSRMSETGKAGTNAMEGGGIVHFLVTYGTSKDRVRAAERRLQEEYPDARIEGPIVYRKGSFALITSFREDQESLVKTVAVGKAPLMEGQKAAVSMALTREGAQLLWESFKGDTPDISLVFDMEFAGVREPYEATIEADWSRVSKHKRLKAGFKYSWFGADVDMLFQELRQDGAIKITTKGENASMDKIIQSTNAKLLQVMFDPAPVDDLSRAAAEKDSYSNLNQAMKMLKDSKGSKSSSLGRSTDFIFAKNYSGPEHALDMNSPGFRQLIAAILDYMVSDANASSFEDSIQQGAFELKENNKKSPKKLTDDERNELRSLFHRGVKFKEEKKYDKAIEAFEECLQRHREITDNELPSANTMANLGFCHDKLGDYDSAADYYRNAARIFGLKSENGLICLNKAQQIEEKAMAKGGSANNAFNTEKNINNDTVFNRQNDTGNLNTVNPNQTKIKVTAANDSNTASSAQTASEAYNSARRADEGARNSGFLPIESQAAVDEYEAYLRNYPAKGQRKTEIEGRIRSLKRRIAAAGGPDPDMPPDPDLDPDDLPMEKALGPVPGSSSGSAGAKAGAGSSVKSSTASESTSPAKPSGGKSSAAKSSQAGKKKPPAKKASAKKSIVDKAPGFSLVASFQMKNIKRSGKMVYHMNHFRSEKQSFTMTENIGSLYRRYKNDTRIFKAVTIDDPVFKQREILVTLDGQDASTFTKYLNFVTVKMKKQHQAGSITSDEIVITPEAFNISGNSFSLNYGYKGDTNRSRWLDYQYQVIWSFHGGVEIRSPWKNENAPMLALYPPYRYRGLTIEGEGEELTEAKVRHAVLTVSSMINGKLITTQATIRNQGPAPALHLDIPEDVKGDKADVSIKWFLKGGKQVISKVQKIEGNIIYWDELPEEGRM